MTVEDLRGWIEHKRNEWRQRREFWAATAVEMAATSERVGAKAEGRYDMCLSAERDFSTMLEMIDSEAKL